ncbi:MAG: hypothetical protein ACR2NZ_14280 [Rubripirellula sp.]
MTNRLLLQAAPMLLILAIASPALAVDPARPCGPDSMTGPLRYLVPQGVGGADFRPACRRHDACYDTLGADKAACDRRYLQEMQCACKNSRHPILCRIVAKIMYKTTRGRGGDRAFASAQRIAAKKLGR